MYLQFAIFVPIKLSYGMSVISFGGPLMTEIMHEGTPELSCKSMKEPYDLDSVIVTLNPTVFRFSFRALFSCLLSILLTSHFVKYVLF